MFIAHWLDNYGKTGLLDIQASYLSGREVNLSQESRLRSALMRGGAAVVRLDLDCWHYVLLTGMEEERVYLFDPYLDGGPIDGVEFISGGDGHLSYNRVAPVRVFESEEIRPYAFGPFETREAVLLFNRRTVLTEEQTVEYYI